MCIYIHIYIYTYVRVANSGHGMAQDMDKMLSGAESRHERAGRTTRHGWHSTDEMQARHSTDDTGTALRTAWLAWHGLTIWRGRPRHGTEAHGLVWPTQGQKGMNPLACTTNPCLRRQGQPIWHGTARSNLALVLGSFHGRHGTACTARHGRHGTASTARRIYLARLAR